MPSTYCQTSLKAHIYRAVPCHLDRRERSRFLASLEMRNKDGNPSPRTSGAGQSPSIVLRASKISGSNPSLSSWIKRVNKNYRNDRIELVVDTSLAIAPPATAAPVVIPQAIRAIRVEHGSRLTGDARIRFAGNAFSAPRWRLSILRTISTTAASSMPKRATRNGSLLFPEMKRPIATTGPPSGSVSPSALLVGVKNQGNAASGEFIIEVYLSTDPKLQETDILLGDFKLAKFNKAQTIRTPVSMTAPADLAPGSYYIIAFADSQDAIGESNEKNNVLGTLQSVSFTK